MKMLSTLIFFFLSLPTFAKIHFKGIKKEVKIIHSSTGIVKRPNQQYFISGDVILKIWEGTYHCDSVRFICKNKELDVYGIHSQTDAYLYRTTDGCPNLIFFPSKGSVWSTCPIR